MFGMSVLLYLNKFPQKTAESIKNSERSGVERTSHFVRRTRRAVELRVGGFRTPPGCQRLALARRCPQTCAATRRRGAKFSSTIMHGILNLSSRRDVFLLKNQRASCDRAHFSRRAIYSLSYRADRRRLYRRSRSPRDDWRIRWPFPGC